MRIDRVMYAVMAEPVRNCDTSLGRIAAWTASNATLSYTSSRAAV
jgi:hypothetical protein